MKISGIDEKNIMDSKAGYLGEVQFEIEINNMSDLAEAVMAYSTCVAVTKTGLRRISDVDYCEFLQFDFDSGIQSSAHVHHQLKSAGITHLIVGSKSHNREKRRTSKGVEIIDPPMERFHVYLAVKDKIRDSEFYKFMIESTASRFEWIFDRKCRDIVHYLGKHSEVLFVSESSPLEIITASASFEIIKKTQKMQDEINQLRMQTNLLKRKEFKNPDSLFSDLNTISPASITVGGLQKSGYFINCPFHTSKKRENDNTTFAWLEISKGGYPALRIICFHNSCRDCLRQYCSKINSQFYEKRKIQK